jgi:hypothetical protein
MSLLTLESLDWPLIAVVLVVWYYTVPELVLVLQLYQIAVAVVLVPLYQH